MSATFEPLPLQYPHVEMLLVGHLRTAAATQRPEHIIFDRKHPASLPVTIAGTTYDFAVIVRDDGGPNWQRLVSLAVRGKPGPAAYNATRGVAEWCAAQLRVLPTAPGVPVADCRAVRGPMSVADDPPEFQITADLLVVGTVTPS